MCEGNPTRLAGDEIPLSETSRAVRKPRPHRDAVEELRAPASGAGFPQWQVRYGTYKRASREVLICSIHHREQDVCGRRAHTSYFFAHRNAYSVHDLLLKIVYMYAYKGTN